MTYAVNAIKVPAIPESYMKLLRLMALHFPEVVIGGGALRDLIFEKPIKDIDLWVNSHEADEAFLLANLEARDHGLGPDTPGVSQPTAAHTVNTVYRGTWDGSRVEVIVLDKPKILTARTIVDTFDLGFCQVGMGRDGMMYVSDAFLKDGYEHAITVVQDGTPHSTWERIRRFTDPGAKYEGWTVDLGPIAAWAAGNSAEPIFDKDNLFRL